MRALVPLEELIEPERLRALGPDPSPRRLREALPRGWALADDHRHAYRDARLLFREGWILILGLVAFGAVGAAFVLGAMPRGWPGVLRLAGLVLALLVLGGVVAPLVTRALHRR